MVVGFSSVQEAAGTFAELRDVVSLRVEAPRPVDVSPEAANMLEKLCLAQAQEVTFEKFRADGKSPSILARCPTEPYTLLSQSKVGPKPNCLRACTQPVCSQTVLASYSLSPVKSYRVWNSSSQVSGQKMLICGCVLKGCMLKCQLR